MEIEDGLNRFDILIVLFHVNEKEKNGSKTISTGPSYPDFSGLLIKGDSSLPCSPINQLCDLYYVVNIF